MALLSQNLHEGKLPPQNIEAEQLLLGTIMLEGSLIAEVIPSLAPDDFYKDAHRKIYEGMCALFNKNIPIEFVRLGDFLRAEGVLELCGGKQYLGKLAELTPTSVILDNYRDSIKNASILRRIIQASKEIEEEAYNCSTLEIPELVSSIEGKMMIATDQALASDIDAGFVHARAVIDSNVRQIMAAWENKTVVSGIPSGFGKLDEMTAGFQKTDLIIIGGRPGMGKTAFALNIAAYAGTEVKESVAIFSLEMSREQLGHRMLCSEALVDGRSARNGFISKQDWEKIRAAAVKISAAGIHINDSSMLTIPILRAHLRRLTMQQQVDLVIVDYLQLMSGDNTSGKRFEKREQEISSISRGLKAIAKEFKVPVVALSQLNREGGKEGSRPTLANLRESGAIEQDADTVIFLHQNKKAHGGNDHENGAFNDDDDLPRTPMAGAGIESVEIIVAKQRNGPTGQIHLLFNKPSTKFFEACERETFEAA